MRRRWFYWKQTIRANRPLLYIFLGIAAVLALCVRNRASFGRAAWELFRVYGVEAAGNVMKDWFPAALEQEANGRNWPGEKPILFSYLEEAGRSADYSEDPAYERVMAEKWEREMKGKSGTKGEGGTRGEPGAGEGTYNEGRGAAYGSSGGEAGGTWDRASAYENSGSEAGGTRDGAAAYGSSGGEAGGTQNRAAAYGSSGGEAGGTQDRAAVYEGSGGGAGETPMEADTGGDMEGGEVIAMKPVGQGIIREKLADYDYMMQNFYSVHPTTTAGRDLMNADKFLSMDLSLEKDEENPQILIYHTHSQEEFSDYPENPEAMITGVGTYLAELLEEKGYQVIHDTSVYDFRDGKLDRSQAYTYALDGINGILQKYPSIEVVLDVHRDGVAEGTRLVKEINGKPTAQIMFFNGTSQTPDGPIEYLPNPNRDANLAFSFQMQLKAAEEYPGFTRKIYLKGLRYNQHVRARTALIEVGAQTNTYEEAKNAMEPLAEILDEVLRGQEF